MNAFGRTGVGLVIVLWAAAAAQGDLVRQRWGAGGKGEAVTHPGTLKVLPAGKAVRLVFDLSAIPKDAKVHHASLDCFTH
jgi:hypothetical protein